MSQETGISQISHDGDSFRVQGVHEGRRSDFRVATADVQALEKAGGKQAVMDFFHRSLGAAREDQRHEGTP
jgi:hypothetical protein